MVIKRRQKTIYKRVVAIVVPVLVFIIMGLAYVSWSLAYQMVHPPTRPADANSSERGRPRVRSAHADDR